MPRFDGTIAGEVNLDLILYGVPEELPRERELLADRMMLTLGGSSVILAHNLAALGSRVGFQARIGERQFRRDRTTPPATKWSRCFVRTARAQHREDGHFAARAMAQPGDVCGNNRTACVG